VPVPRRFDRRPPERDQTRINERIRVPEVRVIDDEGNQVGVLKTPDALKLAQERELDLVEVAPEAKPPVCRILDYSKYKYEQAQKLKQARKHQQQITVREIKFRPKIAEHDYDTKKHHVERFLRHKDKVKVTIMFRGREVTHPERGTAILDRLAEELSELGVVEQRPMQEGRNMTMMMAPSKAVLAGRVDVQAHTGPDGASPPGTPPVAVAPDGSHSSEPAPAPPADAISVEESANGAAASEESANGAAAAESSEGAQGVDETDGPAEAGETDSAQPDGESGGAESVGETGGPEGAGETAGAQPDGESGSAETAGARADGESDGAVS
jgi:translation initiation factor IF-3